MVRILETTCICGEKNEEKLMENLEKRKGEGDQ